MHGPILSHSKVAQQIETDIYRLIAFGFTEVIAVAAVAEEIGWPQWKVREVVSRYGSGRFCRPGNDCQRCPGTYPCEACRVNDNHSTVAS